MTRRKADPHDDSGPPPILRRTEEGRAVYYTLGLGRPPQVHGERLRETDGHTFRQWDPSRSKLGAALVLGYSGPIPEPEEAWLYLGAASGTTASHVADLVGAQGTVYAVERSIRPFARLAQLAERYPNLRPIFGDARHPEEYLGDVPPVDGLYVDIAQPDQPEIVRENASRFLRDGAPLLFALKTASLGRSETPAAFLDRTRNDLQANFRLEGSTALQRFHRGHYFITGRYRPNAERGTSGAPPPRTRARPRPRP